jgi:hypothetical protein
MASKDVVPTDVDETQIVGYNPDDFEWTTVHTEQGDQITFDTIGDTLVAEWLGSEVIEFEDPRKPGETQAFTQLAFMLPGDNPAYVNAGADLLTAFKGLEAPLFVRIQYLKDVDTGQPTPMKSFRVDAAPKRR